MNILRCLFCFAMLMFATVSNGQDIVMQNGTFNQCAGKLFDSGGSGGNYSANESLTTTICSGVANSNIQLNFTQFSTEIGKDVLTIHDGNDSTAPVIGTYSGGSLGAPVIVTPSSTNATGCLTLVFTSNATSNLPGFSADISCVTACSQIVSSLINATPTINSQGVVEVPVGTTVNFVGKALFTSPAVTPNYSWSLGGGATATGLTASNTYNILGTFNVLFTVQDTSTLCSVTTVLKVNVVPSIVKINNVTDIESKYSLEQLVSDVLVKGGCSAVDNFSVKVFGSPEMTEQKSYGFFRRGGALSFPFEEGIVLSTGKAFEGGNQRRFSRVDNQNIQPGDSDLEAALGVSGTEDATFVKFTFKPTIPNISFKFLMASEEYDGTTECNFADSFAFLLREVGATAYTNLAVLPDGTPVSVTNINDANTCRANLPFFAGYRIGQTNYDGRTKALTASANVDVGKTYEIKLVVADQGDDDWDSAIFLEAGSFSLGGDLGADRTLVTGNAECGGKAILNTNAPNANHIWKYNGAIINGQNQSMIEVDKSGNYSVKIEFAAGCEFEDDVNVDFVVPPKVNNLKNLTKCTSTTSASFDLTENTPEALGSQDPASYRVTYHTSQVNADLNVAIPDPANFIGTNNQVIFTKVENIFAKSCSIVDSFILFIASTDIPPLSAIELCDDSVPDGLIEFDLSTQTPNVLGSLVATEYNITYHISEADALADKDPLPTLYTNTSNGQVIYVRLEAKVDSACNNVSMFPLRVNPIEDATFTYNATCSSLEATVTGVTGGVFSFKSAPTDGAVINSVTGEITNMSSNTNYSVTYITPGTCTGTMSLDVKSLIQDNASFTITPTCDGGTVNITGDKGGSFVFKPAPTDGAVVDATTGTITGGDFAKTYTLEYTTAGVCPSVSISSVTTLPEPSANKPTDYLECDGIVNDGLAEFNLLSKNTEIIGGATGVTISYHISGSDALLGVNAIANPDKYINKSNPEVVFVSVTNNTTGCVNGKISFELKVTEAVKANALSSPYVLCDDSMEFDNDTTNDSVFFDLSVKDVDIIGSTQSSTTHHVTYYANPTNASLKQNALPTVFQNTVNPQIVYARVDSDNSVCFDVVPIELKVLPIPSFKLEPEYIICENTNGTEVLSNVVIDTGLNAIDYKFEWSLDNVILVSETAPSYSPTTEGEVAVIVTNIKSSPNCSAIPVKTIVRFSSSPVIVSAEVSTEVFADRNDITVIVKGSNAITLEYSLDYGVFKTSTANTSYVFTDVSIGEHKVIIRDKNGCGFVEKIITVIDYPKFFTPNADGFNDKWQLKGLQNQKDAIISIFDRFGKFLKQINPTGEGWDGTYNGNLMPSSDYWFTLEYKEPRTGQAKVFKSHFTLKR